MIKDELNSLNERFYRENATSFSQTRTRPWNGWIQGLEALKNCLPTKMQVADYAAGNLRFEKYLLEKLGVDRLQSILAIDNCESLLPDDLGALKNIVEFKKCDLVNAIPGLDSNLKGSVKPDLTVCFGFFHHIYGFNARFQFLQNLIDATESGGYLFISFWGFANSESSKEKSEISTRKYINTLSNDIFSELEEDDYILGWKDQPAAFRYCHSFSDEEIARMLLECRDFELIEQFKADGKDNQQNIYVILRRQ